MADMWDPVDVARVAIVDPEHLRPYCPHCRRWPLWSELVKRTRCPGCNNSLDEAEIVYLAIGGLSPAQVEKFTAERQLKVQRAESRNQNGRKPIIEVREGIDEDLERTAP